MKTILIVDDDTVTLNLCRVLLQDLNAKVLTATSGKQALKSLEDTLPDLLIVDILMPNLSGFEFLAKVKEDGKYKGPIIMLTGVKTPKTVMTALQLGAVDYICKPVDREIFVGKVQSLLAVKVPAGSRIKFAEEVTSLEVEVIISAKLVSISEYEMIILMKTPLEENTLFKVKTSIFKEIGIEVPLLRISNCQPIKSVPNYHFELTSHFVGLDEDAMKIIRKWVQTRAIARNK